VDVIVSSRDDRWLAFLPLAFHPGSLRLCKDDRLLSFDLVAKLATQMTFAAKLREITPDWTWSGA
jgi:hypothetical protein